MEFLKNNVKGTSFSKLTNVFNKKFEKLKSVTAISSLCTRYGFKNGRNTRFKESYIPWNKGKKGLSLGGKETQFKKGNIPYNNVSLGGSRISKDGYTEIKTCNPRTWKLKHRIIWEKENGKVPDGCVIIFADGNKGNFSLDNLLLVTRSELLEINRSGLYKYDKELTKTGHKIAKLIITTREKEKRANDN